MRALVVLLLAGCNLLPGPPISGYSDAGMTYERRLAVVRMKELAVTKSCGKERAIIWHPSPLCMRTGQMEEYFDEHGVLVGAWQGWHVQRPSGGTYAVTQQRWGKAWLCLRDEAIEEVGVMRREKTIAQNGSQ